MVDNTALNKYVHSRSMLLLVALVVGVCTFMAYAHTPHFVSEAPAGFVVGWGDLALMIPPVVGLGIAVALNIGIVLMMLYINKTYSLLRGMALTRMQPTVFLLIQLGMPLLLCTASSGALAAFVVMWCVNLLYSIYGSQPTDVRKVFGVFALMSVLSTFDYTYVVYAIVFVVACFQLRLFSLRCILAILMGIVTPWIILFGFGIVSVEQLQMPYLGPSMPEIGGLQLTAVIITAVVALVAFSNNLVKYIAYNASLRAMIGVITVLTLITILAMVIDAEHMLQYLVMLNVCASFQVAHVFNAIYNYGRAWTAVLLLALMYMIIYVLYML